VLTLLLVVILIGAVLTAVLWGGTLFLQSYFYTEPTEGIVWQAPLAAGVLTFFYLCWAILNVAGGTMIEGRPEIPYGVVWQFSNRLYLVNDPVPQFESKAKSDTESHVFKRLKAAGPYVYKREDSDERWNPKGVEWVKFTHDSQEYKFVPEKSQGRGYSVFVDEANGWEMREIDMGQPTRTSFFRLVFYFLLNVIHLVLWIALLWLVLRFAPGHAVLLGFVLWLVFTLAVFPLLFSQAAGVVG
jgi:hypothetical protein